MRAILVLVGLAAVVLVVLMSLGWVRIEQKTAASLPTISFNGGTAPVFKADVGKIDVGTTNTTISVPTVNMTNTTVQLPTVKVEKPVNSSAPAQ